MFFNATYVEFSLSFTNLIYDVTLDINYVLPQFFICLPLATLFSCEEFHEIKEQTRDTSALAGGKLMGVGSSQQLLCLSYMWFLSTIELDLGWFKQFDSKMLECFVHFLSSINCAKYLGFNIWICDFLNCLLYVLAQINNKFIRSTVIIGIIPGYL